jgi:flagellar basal-body rod protein FlgB
MSISGFRDTLGVHADALALRAKRSEVLASNIANAATPHYKARDLDFNAHYSAALGVGALDVTNENHIANPQVASPGGLSYRVPVSTSLDGNTVDMATEQMEFAENTIRYQGSLQLLNRRIAGLMSAIKGE